MNLTRVALRSDSIRGTFNAPVCGELVPTSGVWQVVGSLLENENGSHNYIYMNRGMVHTNMCR